MNLHVTNDVYGLYTLEIAARINASINMQNNKLVDISEGALYTAENADYLGNLKIAHEKYVLSLTELKKIIFHPYNLEAYEFLKLVKKRFPSVIVYWICWSMEIYNLPHLIKKQYDPFSLQYVKSKSRLWTTFKSKINITLEYLKVILGLKKSYFKKLEESLSVVDFFLSPLPTDFYYLNKNLPTNKIKYHIISYLSVNVIISNLNFRSHGNKVMIGHCAATEGNHFEILHKLSKFNSKYSILLPLVYGDKIYGQLIAQEAKLRFSDVEILEIKLERGLYYQKLGEIGWAIFNTKVQQAFGNILGLIWMGVKVFLDKNTSTYIDFSAWGIIIFSIQEQLNEKELEVKLSNNEVMHNQKIIMAKFGEAAVSGYWNNILS